MQVEVGRLLGGRYRIQAPLGEGGMAVVWRAAHIVTGVEYALKVLRPHEDPKRRRDAKSLFEREFTTLAQVSHPRIVAGHDYGIDAHAGPFYAMELLDGGDLQARTRLPWREACAIARDICAALSLLHSRRLVYRDLSPKNVRCTGSGVAKLIDFGAMMPFGAPTETVGTPPFVAPEALSAELLDGRTDLYALGATLYYALTGHHAYPARTMAQLWELWGTVPVPPSSYVPELPEGLDRLVMQLIQHDALQRPSDAAEVMQRLEAIADLPADEKLHVGHAYLVAPKLVGREKELRKLRDTRSAVATGRAVAVRLSGPHGIGCSRLLEESLLHAKVEGFVAVVAKASLLDDGEYSLFRALAEAVLHAVPDVARQAIQAEHAVLSEILPQLRPAHSAQAVDAPPERERNAALQSAGGAWLAAIAGQQPLCLVVEDAAQADVPSLALLANLIGEQAAAPIVLVWSAANEERAAADWPLALTLLERASTVVTLPALSPVETEELLSGVFGDVPNLSQLARYVQDTSAGNPRDALQLLQHLITEGVLKHEAGAWSLPARWTSDTLPSSMLHALEQRAEKLSRPARLLAFALGAEPKQRFTLEECELLLHGIEAADCTRNLQECLAAGVVERVGATFRLAQLGFGAATARATAAVDQAAQHRRLAHLHQQRGDGFRAAGHLLSAGESAAGLDLLLATSSASELRTDRDMHVYFNEMRALPSEWLALFQDGLRLCHALGRPEKDKDILLSRAVGFAPIAATAPGSDGFALLKIRLERLVRDVGLDLYAALPESMDGGTRLKTALEAAKKRHDAAPVAQRVFEPMQAIRPLCTTLLVALAITSITNDVAAQRQLPQLGPLIALSPALWVIQQTSDGVRARLEGRLEHAAHIYRGLLERMAQPDRGGLQETESRSAWLRISLSMGTLEACMGLPSARKTADAASTDRDYETQALMVRHLADLWLGRLAEAASTRQAIERRRAFSTTHNNFDGQYLLGELTAQSLLNDLTGLRQSTEAAKRMAAQHPIWAAVVLYCQGEYECSRGDMTASLERLEQAVMAMGGARGHQLWSNAAAAHVRVLVELARHEEACTLGARYLAQAEAAGLGYLVNYIRIALSQALAPSDMAAAAALADRAVTEFQQLGSVGLNMVYALENRARLASLAGDQEAFERMDALSRAESAVLSRRLRRVAAGARTVRESAANPAIQSTLMSELSSALGGSTELGERSRRALRVLHRLTEARGAVCYVRSDRGLERIAAVGEVPHLEQLDQWAPSYFEGQLFAHDAATSQLDGLTDIVPTVYGLPSGMYVPRMIGHSGQDGSYVHTGLVVLLMPRAPDTGWMSVFSETLSRSFAGGE